MTILTEQIFASLYRWWHFGSLSFILKKPRSFCLHYTYVYIHVVSDEMVYQHQQWWQFWDNDISVSIYAYNKRILYQYSVHIIDITICKYTCSCSTNGLWRETETMLFDFYNSHLSLWKKVKGGALYLHVMYIVGSKGARSEFWMDWRNISTY